MKLLEGTNLSLTEHNGAMLIAAPQAGPGMSVRRHSSPEDVEMRSDRCRRIRPADRSNGSADPRSEIKEEFGSRRDRQ